MLFGLRFHDRLQSFRTATKRDPEIMSYEFQPLVAHDSPGLACALISTFYKNPHRALMWPNMTCKGITHHYLRRLPDILLAFRDLERHEKIIHTPTGEVVGYSRWLFPTRLLGNHRSGFALFWDAGRFSLDPRGSPTYDRRWKRDVNRVDERDNGRA